MTTRAQNPWEVLQGLQQRVATVDQQLLRTWQAVAALQAESTLRLQQRQSRMPIEFRSQLGEDVAAWNLLNRQTSGFFIEAGAFDGYECSVTYALEAVGWEGLLVEPIPQRAHQCATRRPHSRVVNAVLSNQGGGAGEFWVVDDAYGGMLSYSKATGAHLKMVGALPKSAISVPRTTLNELLADHHGEIDLVVLDVEGAELDVLQGFDLPRFRPRLLLVEENADIKSAVQNFMQAHGYRNPGSLASDGIYIRDDQADMIERFKFMVAI